MLASVKIEYSKLATRSPGFQDSEQEFLEERNCRRKPWKPWSIRPVFLTFFICFCVALTVVVELLLRKSHRDGGLIFKEPDEEALPMKADVLFNYLPTTISVAFGLVWASADHNYKRLEPFFQLSKPGGATAEHSLLLDYSYSFQLFIPYKAFKKRHWSVYCSSTIMVIVSLFLTPSMSGIFDLVGTYIPGEITEISRANLYSAQDLTKSLSTKPSYLAYNYVWQNSSLPKFTTAEYAILPFQSPPGMENGDRWAAESILYEADLNCRDAKIVETKHGCNITNEQGCSYHFIQNSAGNNTQVWDGTGISPAEGLRALETLFTPIRDRWFDGLFFGYANNSRERSPDLYSLSSPLARCSDKHKFLVSSGGYLDYGSQTNFNQFTSKFCTPAYWSQSVKVTMEMTKSGVGRIVNVDRLEGKRNPFNDFNITSFEELVATGRASPSENLFGDFPLDAPRAPKTYKSYHLNPRSLESLPGSHEDAFKLLFALAVSSEFVDDSQNSTTTINGTRLYGTQAYITNELWCRLSQVGFGVLSLLTFCLLVSTWNRKCNLDGEPNSLAALMQTLSQSPALRQKMENSEFRHPIDQRELLIESKSIYRLRLNNDQGPYIEVTDVEGKKTVQPESYDLYNEPAQKEGLAPVEMVWGPIGFLYTFYFTILLSIILFVYIADKTNGGLRFYAPESSFKFKLIFSHLPTITGTSIEPLWILIGTYACMVAPYEILRRGHAPSSKTLTIDYDKTPPHFQTFQALKTGNFGLAALTIAIILANFLAVALGGLFSPRPFISTKVGYFLVEPLNITSNQVMGEDSYFLLAANLSGNALLPNWTVPEFYIMGFGGYGTDWVSSTLSMEAETIGFGTNISCELLPENEVIIRRPTGTPNGFQLDADHECWAFVSAEDNCQGTCWDETSNNTSTGFLIDSSCPGTFFVGWAEWLPQYTETKATVLICNSNMIISKVSATVDSLHQIVSYNKLGMFSEARVDNMISRALLIIPGTSRAVVFDDLFQKSISTSSNVAWIGVLMAQLQPKVRQTGNATDMPDTTYVVEAFESAYRQLYAVNLRINAEHDSYTDYPGVDFDTVYNKTSMQYRVYVSTPMFSISLSIIISFLLLLLWVHIVRPGRGLTHLPRSMADTFTLLYASDAMEDCSQLRGENVRARGRMLDKMEDTYGYGLFKTPDGEEHFGVHKGSSSSDEGEVKKGVLKLV